MKIGIFTDCYYPQINGVVTSIMNLQKGLEERGNEVFIITPAVKNYEDADVKHIIRTPSIPFPNYPEFRIGLFGKYTRSYNKIKALNFDIIHTQTEFSMGHFGKAVAKDLNIPSVHTYHTLHEEYTHHISRIGQRPLKKVARIFSKEFVKPFSAVIAPTEKTKKIIQSYGVKNKIFIEPTGIDLKKFKIAENKEEIKKIKQKLGLKQDSFKIIFLGRIAKEKNISLLLKIFPKILEKNKNIELIIVGDGPHKIELEDQTKELGISKNVFFTNRIENANVPLYYKLANIFVSPSKTETQGLTILEAMAAGLPVLVYDDTNVEGVVFNKKNGLLFKTEEDLINQLEYAINNENELEKYKIASHSIIDKFSSKGFAERVETIYKSLIEDKENS